MRANYAVPFWGCQRKDCKPPPKDTSQMKDVGSTFASKDREAMMTKEEVAAIVAYCQENKVSFKQRLAELGVPEWTFYEAKRKYAPKETGGERRGVPSVGARRRVPSEPDPAIPFQKYETESGVVLCCTGEHRAPYSHGNRDADQRQPDGPPDPGDHPSVVRPCLVWTTLCAIGYTASRRTCGRASTRCRGW